MASRRLSRAKLSSPPPLEDPIYENNNDHQGLIEGQVSQKEFMLKYQSPEKNGRQVVRLPTSTEWLTQPDMDEEQLKQYYEEVCVNQPSAFSRAARRALLTSPSNPQNQQPLISNGMLIANDGSIGGLVNSGNQDDLEDEKEEEDDLFDNDFIALEAIANGPSPDDFQNTEADQQLIEYLQSMVDAQLYEHETPEQRQDCLDQKRKRLSRYDPSETIEQRAAPLKKARDYKRKLKIRRAEETPEQRSERLRKQRERRRQLYARQSPEQRRRRLEKMREYRRKQTRKVHIGHPSSSDDTTALQIDETTYGTGNGE